MNQLLSLSCLLFTEKISYEEFEQIMKEEVLSKSDPQFDLLEAFRFAFFCDLGRHFFY